MKRNKCSAIMALAFLLGPSMALPAGQVSRAIETQRVHAHVRGCAPEVARRHGRRARVPAFCAQAAKPREALKEKMRDANAGEAQARLSLAFVGVPVDVGGPGRHRDK